MSSAMKFEENSENLQHEGRWKHHVDALIANSPRRESTSIFFERSRRCVAADVMPSGGANRRIMCSNGNLGGGTSAANRARTELDGRTLSLPPFGVFFGRMP